MQNKPLNCWIKNLFKCFLYGSIIFLAWIFFVRELYEYTRHCHRLPFQALFSKHGITTCGEIVKVTLIPKDTTDPTNGIDFHIPTEYLEQPRNGGVSDKIKLVIAFPSFEPWYWVKEKYAGRKDVYPMEIDVRLNDVVNKKPGHTFGDEEFVDSVLDLNLYKYWNCGKSPKSTEIFAEKMCPTGYYYPTDMSASIEDMPLRRIVCGSFCISQEVKCWVDTVYSRYLYGKYSFRHRDLNHWKEIDKEIRKLIEKFMHTQREENVYFINFSKE